LRIRETIMAEKKKTARPKAAKAEPAARPGAGGAKVQVAVCGGSGYAGAELLRLLAGHPRVEVTAVTSERSRGESPADLHPHLRQAYAHLKFEPLDTARLGRKADVFFMALPHAASQEAVAYFYKKGKYVLDLSADYRLKNHLIYERWYKTPHKYHTLLKEAVYGLPEVNRARIKGARLVAVPGCYPTSAILALRPLVEAGVVDPSTIIIDSKSGTTGAGRKADLSISFCEVNEGFKAYGIATHRHTPEIEQELSRAADKPVTVDFTPHLVPMDRGILTTAYARLARRAEDAGLKGIFAKAYGNEPFVHVLPEGQVPNVKHVRGTNECRIGYVLNERTSRVIVVSVIDNLVKGAAGQAVQNMNVALGFKETLGLELTALCP
jgi:N-acetyl-gamma-glutamyl-phosphate reductase